MHAHATDLELHQRFRRTGDAAAAAELLSRHGAAVLGWLQQCGISAPNQPFCQAFAAGLAQNHAEAQGSWLAQCLRRANPGSRPDSLGADALWLRGRLALPLTDVAAALGVAEPVAATAMAQLVLSAAQLSAEHAAYHLQDGALAGLALGTLQGPELAQATGHAAWCLACQHRTAEIYVAASQLPLLPLPEVPAEWVRQAQAAAVQARDESLVVPRVLRFWGLRAGAPWRPLRLAAIGAVVLAWAAAWLSSEQSERKDKERVQAVLTVRGDPQLLAGATSAVAVALESVNERGQTLPGTEGVAVAVQLRDAEGKTLATAEGKTAAGGVALVQLAVPALKSETAVGKLWASATAGGQIRQAQLEVMLQRGVRQHLSSDKPTYQPGQTVHLRSLSLDLGSGKPLAGQPARLELLDPNGTRLARQLTTVSPMGVAFADVELSAHAPLGTYTAQLTVQDQTESLPLTVERYALPPFTVQVKPQAKSTDGLGDIAVEVAANFTTGAGMNQSKVRFHAEAGSRTLLDEEKPVVDGKAVFVIKASQFPRRDGSDDGWGGIAMSALVRDPAGRAESGRAFVPRVSDNMAVTMRSEAPSLRRNLPQANKIIVRTLRPGDVPVQTTVALYSPGQGERFTVGAGERLGEAKTGADGMAALDLPPAYFGRPLAALATDPRDGKKYWTTYDPPPLREGPLVLRCDQGLLRAGQKLTCDVFAPLEQPVELRAAIGGRLVSVAATAGKRGIVPVALQLPADAHGLLHVSAAGSDPQDAVYALVSPADGLRVDLGALPPARPGDEVAIRLKVSDGAGKPKSSAVGLALVDAAVFARVKGETPLQALRSLLLGKGTGDEYAALLFPEAQPGTAGGQGNWTAAQQAAAKWLLAQASGSPAELRSQDSKNTDESKLAQQKYAARDRADRWQQWAKMAALLLLALALILASLWLRVAIGAAALALAGAVALRVLLRDGLDLRSSTSDDLAQLGGLLLFGGLNALAFVWRRAWLRARDQGRGEVARGWPRLRAAMVVAVAGCLAMTIVLPQYREMAPMPTSAAPFGGGAKIDDAPGFIFRDNESEGGEDARPAAAARMEEKKAEAPPPERRARAMAEAPTGGAASKLFAGDKGEIRSAMAAALDGKDGAAEPAAPVRKDFPETMYWNPGIVTGENGLGEVKLRAADSITAWQALALASDAQGSLGAGQGELVVNQPFHVDVDVPHDLSVGDDVAIQVSAQNETDTAQSAQLTCQADAGLQLEAAPLAEPKTLPPHGVAGAILPVKAVQSGAQQVTVKGQAGPDADAIQRPIEVWPNGKEVKQVFAGMVTDRIERTIDIPPTALPDGRKVTLTLLGSPLAAALDGLELLAEQPAGCAEQLASQTYVNALLLQALRQTGRLPPDRDAALLRQVRLGYQDLLAHERTGGGFGWLDGSRHGLVTAWVLLALQEIAKVTYVDDKLLERTQRAVTSQADSNGSFGGPAETAYVAMALLQADPQCLAVADPAKPWPPDIAALRKTCSDAVRNTRDALAVTKGVDSYILALGADALIAAGDYYRKDAEALLDELDTRGTIVGEGLQRRVSFQPRSKTWCGSTGTAAEAETTAMVTHALLVHGQRNEKAREALRALLALRDSDGGFHTTQAAALSLRAILRATQSAKAGGTAKVLIDGAEAASLAFDPSSAAAPVRIDLTGKVQPQSKLQLVLTGWDSVAGDLSYKLATRHFVPWPQAGAPVAVNTEPDDPAAGTHLALRQTMDKAVYNLGDRALQRVWLRQSTHGHNGMVLIQVGLPPGFRMPDGAIADLYRDGVRRVEPYARGLAVFVDGNLGYGTSELNIPLEAMRAVRKVQVPRSRAYYYYQPQVEAQAPPIAVQVTGKAGTGF